MHYNVNIRLLHLCNRIHLVFRYAYKLNTKYRKKQNKYTNKARLPHKDRRASYFEKSRVISK